jgi:hypothetical protein
VVVKAVFVLNWFIIEERRQGESSGCKSIQGHSNQGFIRHDEGIIDNKTALSMFGDSFTDFFIGWISSRALCVSNLGAHDAWDAHEGQFITPKAAQCKRRNLVM